MRETVGETTRRMFLRLARAGIVAIPGTIYARVLFVAADTAYLYTDPLDRFALTIPDGWTQQQTTDAALAGAWAAGNGSALFTVVYLPISDGTAAEDFQAQFLPLLIAQPGYTEVDRRYVSLHNGDKPLLDYFTTDATGRAVRVQQIFLTHGQDGLVITFRCLAADAANYATVVGSMVGSFVV